MKYVIGAVFLLAGLGIAAAMIAGLVSANYEFNRDYGSYWSLGVKASTIEKKSEYVDKFVEALDKSGLQGQSNSLFFPTPDNSFDANFASLKTLQARLHEIKTMKPDSFEYQTAIQQITGQEQDEAGEMLREITGCWWKVHAYWLWNDLISLSLILLAGILLVISAVAFSADEY